MSKVKLSFVFDRKNKIKSTLDKGIIELRYYLEGVAKYHATKIEAYKIQWHEVKKIIKHPEADALNDEFRRTD